MEKELLVIDDGYKVFNIIDYWDDGCYLKLNMYEDLENEDDITTMGFLLDVKDVKNLIRVLQEWVRA